VSNTGHDFVSRAESLGWKALEENVAIDLPYPAKLAPGAGLTNFLIEKLTVPYCVIALFIETGDNTQPAQVLANSLNQLINLGKSEQKWIIPTSWKILYGPETEMRELF
jgi:hypothetical protein